MIKRNQTVDIIRGIAMLLVVLGHTISGTCIGYENTFLFKVIWTLQMPMFFIISGYVTRYSKPISSSRLLLKYLRKRTFAYIIPWIVWSFVVRGFILGQSSFFNLRHLLWHMDDGYWFLVSLWTIVTVYGFSDWLTVKCHPRTIFRSIIFHFVFALIGMIFIGGIGMCLGISFLSIKLSLYYLPLFMIGYLYGQLQDLIMKWEISHSAVSVTYAISFALWLFLIKRVNFYNVEPTVELIILRYLASAFGCVAIMGLISSCYAKMGGGVGCRKIFARNIPSPLSISRATSNELTGTTYGNAGFRDNDSTISVNSNNDDISNIYSFSEYCAEQSTVLQRGLETKTIRFMTWAGKNSLAIYLLHGFFLNLCINAQQMHALSALNVLFVMLNYFLCIGILAPIITIIGTNKVLNKILFWK